MILFAISYCVSAVPVQKAIAELAKTGSELEASNLSAVAARVE